MTVGKDTAALLQELYRLAHLQAGFSKKDLTLEIDWAGLRLRLEDSLVREGIEVPALPEVKEVTG